MLYHSKLCLVCTSLQPVLQYMPKSVGSAILVFRHLFFNFKLKFFEFYRSCFNIIKGCCCVQIVRHTASSPHYKGLEWFNVHTRFVLEHTQLIHALFPQFWRVCKLDLLVFSMTFAVGMFISLQVGSHICRLFRVI